jgi:hypothetical protein
MPRSAHRLTRRFGLDALPAQALRKGLAPALQVGLAWVQPLAVLGLRPHAEVHMRVRLVVVQHHHVVVVGQPDPGELARRLLHGQRIGAARHRQHDVVGLASGAVVVDARAAHLPLPLDGLQCLLAAFGDAAIVFDRQPAVLADVAQVCGDGHHAPAAAGDLDHHLRGAPDGGRDAAADGGSALAGGVQARGL